MRRFLVRIVLAGICAGLILLGIVAVRIVRAQPGVDARYDLPAGTEVLCLGSSHTGCTWYEAPEFKNRALWNTSRGLAFSLMRLREVERRGGLKGLKLCFVDCDLPSISGLNHKAIVEQFVEELPVSWRYVGTFDVSGARLFFASLIDCGRSYMFQCVPPEGEDDRPWLSRTPEERTAHLKRIHGDGTSDGRPATLPADYAEQALDIVREIKDICERNDVRLVLFASPQATDNPARVHRDRYGWAFDVIAQIRATGVTYCDWHDACPDDMFRDEGHLTRHGAYAFTKRILGELNYE